VHQAYDLALATGYMFSGRKPILREVSNSTVPSGGLLSCYVSYVQVDRILFRKPVDIGNLIRLTSRVTYSTGKITKEDCGEENVAKAVPAIMVEVLCNIINPEK
jgi:hypothetical protein